MKNHYKKIILALALSLAACNESQDKSTSEYQGLSYARAAKTEIHNQYLACYALQSAAKKECTNKLAEKYINMSKQQDKEYVEAFQFESEKLGFKYFLNNLNLPCESIKDGPKFTEDKKAYVVSCKPNHKYFMQFNYDNNEWKLIEEGNSD